MRSRLSLTFIMTCLLLALGATAAEAQADVAVDPTTLDETPVLGGGVRGFVQPSVAQNWRVHAFAEIGDRIYVGGSFTEVRNRPWAVSPTFDQPFLAAFDLETNTYIPEFAPELDDAVWSLAVHNGNLVVGGEFDRVNNANREGLVALDPITGATVGSFKAQVANAGADFEASVRSMEVIGNQLYIVGDFNRVIEGGEQHSFNRAARVDATTGNADLTWKPWPFGGGVFDIAVDTARAKAYLVGSFTSVNGSIETTNIAAVDLVDGGTLAGHPKAPQNRNNNRTYAVDLLGRNVWLGGEQHFVEVHRRGNWNTVACMVTGYGTVDEDCGYIDHGPNWPGKGLGGGDYQVLEEIDGFMVTGCHCRWLLFSSVTQEYLNLLDRGVRLYDENGLDIDFFPGATIWNEGPYAAFGDSRGCLYLGGDFTGTVDGFARYCSPGDLVPFGPPDAEAEVDGSTVSIDWSASEGTKGYLVHRDGDFIQFSLNPGFEENIADGVYRYDVRAQRPDGSYSSPTTLTVSVGAPQTLIPPPNVQVALDGDDVRITWDRVAAAQGYLVHKNWTFLTYTTSRSHVDRDLGPGLHRYQVRAQNAAGENSDPSPIVRVEVGAQDDTPPSTPTGLTVDLDAGAGTASLSWQAADDNVGVTGYLVHRNWGFLGYTVTTSYIDDELAPATRHRYQVRAQDAAGNNSTPTAIVGVDVP